MLAVSPVLLVWTLLAVAAVDVRSRTNCPSTEHVAERLQPLLPHGATTAVDGHVATLDAVEAEPDGSIGMRLRLLRADESVIGDRRLLLRGSCLEMAEAVAAMIAAWETKPHPGRAADIEQPGHTANVAASLPASTAARNAAWLRGGLSVGAAFVGGSAGLGNAELQIGRAGSRWRMRIGMVAETSRRIDVGPGYSEWRHTMIAVGLLMHSLGSSWLWSFDLGPGAGWVSLQGRRFMPDRKQSSFEYSVTSGARAGRHIGRFSLWLEARGSLWLRGQHVWATGSAATADLPRGDVGMSLGATFPIF